MGLVVTMALPRFHGSADAAAPAEALHVLPLAEAGTSVLVVEDEPSIRMVVVDALAEQGYAVHEAADGGAGLRVLATDARIDLLLTDIGLPGGISGRDLADTAWRERPGLKVLFVTALVKSAVDLKGLGADVIEKPFAVDALVARVHALIGAHQSHPAPAGATVAGAVHLRIGSSAWAPSDRPAAPACRQKP
jgi:DNA-binding response OmpR family regulator